MNMKAVTPTIWRGEAPTSLADMREISKNFKTCLSLEYGFNSWFSGNFNRETEWAEQVGVEPLQIKMSDFFPPKPAELDTALKILQEKESVYVHCLHGVDRTGFVCAAYRVKVQKWTWQAAYAELIANGFHNWCYFWWVPSLKEYLGVKDQPNE